MGEARVSWLMCDGWMGREWWWWVLRLELCALVDEKKETRGGVREGEGERARRGR